MERRFERSSKHEDAVSTFLLFVNWHTAEEQQLLEFDSLCVNDEETKALIPSAEIFMRECCDSYQLVLEERRI